MFLNFHDFSSSFVLSFLGNKVTQIHFAWLKVFVTDYLLLLQEINQQKQYAVIHCGKRLTKL